MGGGEAATLQVHHPQRFDAEAWRVVAALERDLGCLVGTNSYLTPPGGAQGLAPHWDDVDVWVVQVEGRKHWTVYERRGENTDAVAPSGDLARGSRFVSGRVELEAVLSPGDVLYIPRGTVHQARLEPLQGPRLQRRRQRRRAGQIEHQLDPGVGGVHVLATGPRRPRKPPPQFGHRDQHSRAYPQISAGALRGHGSHGQGIASLGVQPASPAAGWLVINRCRASANRLQCSYCPSTTDF